MKNGVYKWTTYMLANKLQNLSQITFNESVQHDFREYNVRANSGIPIQNARFVDLVTEVNPGNKNNKISCLIFILKS
jgi:hypothetical protein